jgi:hypothetical protein
MVPSHRLFARIGDFSTIIIPHVASRLKPANEPNVPCGITRPAPKAFLRPRQKARVLLRQNAVNLPPTLALLQHSRVIDCESRVRMRSSLVIHFAQDQDEFINSIRQQPVEAGQLWTN